MTETYVIKDVTQDLSFLLSLTKLFEVDSQGFWIDSGTKERYKHVVDNNTSGKEIIIFQDPLPKGDYHLFNPYAEGFGKKSEAVQLFFKTVRISFNLCLQTVMMHVISEVAEHKEAIKEDPTHKLSNGAVRMTHLRVDPKSTLYDCVDDKLVAEFDKICSRIDESADEDFIFVPYIQMHMTAKVKCDALTDPKWDEKFGKDIRKKSLLAFKAAIMGVLGISDISQLENFNTVYDTELKTAPRLWATLTTYLKLYSKFNDMIPVAFAVNDVPADEEAIDLGELQSVLDRSGFAYGIAKHVVQPVPPKKTVIDTSTIDTPKINLGGGSNLARPGSRFAPQIIETNQNRGLGTGLSIRGQERTSRFKPQILDQGPTDPFAPVSAAPSSGLGTGLNRGGMGQSYFGSDRSSGLSINPRSNFGSPETTRRYF